MNYEIFLAASENKRKLIKSNKQIYYYNTPNSFDIETSSYYINGQKCANMYMWETRLSNHKFKGRTWAEFVELINEISNLLETSINRRLVIYVHNLAYEFQFMRKFFSWYKIFSLSNRKVIYAITDEGIEFRCSYILSGYSLEYIGNNLLFKHKVKKLVGDLDYKLIRHNKTIITDKEWGYLDNDCEIVVAYISELLDKYENVSNLPLTKTSVVRNLCRERCFREKGKKSDKKRRNYSRLIKSLTLTADEYEQLKKAFQGGYTHGSNLKINKVFENVDSYDFTSSYPFVMCSEKFPMESSCIINSSSIDFIKKASNNYCCLFDIKFKNLNDNFYFEHYISSSRCKIKGRRMVDNGRVVFADELETTITEQDLDIILQTYTFDDVEITNLRLYRKAYLPYDIINFILDLYEDKTKFKDVEGKEIEYMGSKENINSMYGMAVTDIVRDEITYDNNLGWGCEKADIENSINSYNNSSNRFLFYPWGVWVTAYARHNLWEAIIKLKDDYLYSDTDSVKIKNSKKYSNFFNDYNKKVVEKLSIMCDFYRIDIRRTYPKTIKGEYKILGIWDFDGSYKKFKTLGAKRYMYECKDGWKLTVAGLGKTVAKNYILEESKKLNISPLDFFKDGMYIPPEHSGKLTHTYIDDMEEFYGIEIVDYQGNVSNVLEKSAVHLENSHYELSMSEDFINYLMEVQHDI